MSNTAVVISTDRLREVASRVNEYSSTDISQMLVLVADSLDALRAAAARGEALQEAQVLDGSASEASALAKLRDVLGLKEADATVTMNNAAVRIKRLTAEAAQFTATGSTLSPEVAKRLQDAINKAMGPDQQGAHGGKDPFNPLDVQRALNAVLGTATGDAEEPVNARRYKHVRTLNPHQFSEIYKENLQSNVSFDALIDHRIAVAEGTGAGVDGREHPPIGSEAWYTLLTPSDRPLGREYAEKKTPVVVMSTTEAGSHQWAVVFQGTSFWADSFVYRDDAVACATAWHDACAIPGASPT
jgi:hypothetical protein